MPDPQRYCAVNGMIVAEEEAALSPFDRGFIYGDAIYEVIPGFHGVPFALAEHVHRLYRSAAAAYISLPADPGALTDLIHETVAANEGWLTATPVCRFGVWVSRGVQSTRWKAEVHSIPTVVVFCWPIDDAGLRRAYRDGIRAVVAGRRRIPADVLDPRVKMTSRLPMVLAELETAQQGDTPVLLDADGRITEGSSSNFFMVSDGMLRTPRAEHALEGVTRGLVMGYARDEGIQVHECDITLYDCTANAAEVFMTSSSAGVVPVRQVVPCTREFDVPGPVTRRLMERFAKASGFFPVR
jgi:branched-chain amino acid aminotransferase